MARARNIKPGLFENEELAELGPFDRLLFIGLWTLADREGRLEDRPKRIKMKLFPGDDYDVDEGLAALADKGFVSRYEVEGFAVVEVANFLKHQKPHGTEKDSLLPDANGFLTVNERGKGGCVTGGKHLVHVSGVPAIKGNNVNPTLDNGSATVAPQSDNALILRFTDSPNPEEEQELAPQEQRPAPEPEQGPPANEAKRGTRLPADWTLPDDWLAWALSERPEFGEAAMRKVGESFGDHWRAATGKGATKLDWQATWRNWVRNQRIPIGVQRAGPSLGSRPSNFVNLPKHTPDMYREESAHDGPNF
ncbi:conserved phage protein [Pseudomonas knackmussii B13]|uniref:Conserved phage protein n=1 Tax=Pseudomonas knackmussii (strain DSM 6978 / CCUG 54928 / LMG 23759 / B13) TaxID=1301098 RepID=A0A024HNW5_PSEKB|nr:hypothetical protein [Pseudomonas knackmussii]CDF86354.1 conserved phage protein [Pseudomonas knackmussii B13]